MTSTPAARPRRPWDLFCRVVDNYGDAGVCWRLAADLAARGQPVRLWIDDASPLRWMAPDGAPGVQVRDWPPASAGPAAADAAVAGVEPGEVVVEAFGCDPPDAYIAAMARAADAGRPPVWINLEYLSAEDYVERSHGLRSPRMADPGRGLEKWFFYPGFTGATGGLLREPGLVTALDHLDHAAWRASHGVPLAPGERLATLFCYPDSDLAALVDALHRGGEPWCLAAAPGAPAAQARARRPALPPSVRLVELPWLPQVDFDRLLAGADLNLVRGEDSFVRAQWAARPFVWQIYRQDDGVHAEKLDAFLGRLFARSGLAAGDPAREAWAAWHRHWNGLGPAGGPPLPAWTPALLDSLRAAAGRWRADLLDHPDLVGQLIAFVDERR